MFDAETEVKKLQEELKAQAIEIHQLQRNQNSRRGVEGPRGRDGRDGKDSTVPGPRGPEGEVKAEDVAKFATEYLNSEAGYQLIKAAVQRLFREASNRKS
jgi:hypothetical protein